MADLHINFNKGWEYKWEKWEDDILRKHYPLAGYSEVIKYLPHRNKRGIRSRASALGIRYLTYNKYYFESIDTNNKAYWLGFLYADGYVTTQNRWGLELAEVDKYHMQKLLADMDSNIQLKHRCRNGYNNCYFLINNTKMHEDLINCGVLMNKTKILKFPNNNIIPNIYISDFIRGFFDGDGSVSFSIHDYIRKDRNNRTYNNLRKIVSFVCESESFIKDLQNELYKNNIKFKLYECKRDNLFTLSVSNSENIINFYNFIYNNSNESNRLDRKYEKFNKLIGHL